MNAGCFGKNGWHWMVVAEGPPLFWGASIPKLHAIAIQMSCSSSRSPRWAGEGESMMERTRASSSKSEHGQRHGWTKDISTSKDGSWLSLLSFPLPLSTTLLVVFGRYGVGVS